MSDSNVQSEPLDPRQLRAQAAALAAHLQRSGVQFLPQRRPEVAQSLRSRFHNSAAIATEPELPATTTTASSRPPAPVAGQGTAAQVPANRPASLQPPRRLDSVAAFAFSEGPYPGDPLPTAARQPQLDLISGEVAACMRCEILANCRTKTVFGEGNPSPRVVFFGEGPGADEDRSGRPFVGKAGQLLTRMIEACKFRREDVYIFNTVKCRPPGNRNPEPDEIENCRDYYQRQLNILRPEYIVCLGAISSQELLRTKLSVGRLRGRLHTYFESKVLVTYHPAYLLRNPAAKKAAWTDLRMMLQDAGIEV